MSVQTLLASITATATAGINSSAVSLTIPANGFHFLLDTTALATEINDTLDLWIQTQLDGTTWIDVIQFVQKLGNGSADLEIATINMATTEADFVNSAMSGVGTQRALFGPSWRTRYVIVDPGAGASSFTFSVVAVGF